ncbi:MAG: prepilin-type N-terminal cleavage/methylation protein [Ramlibacter sp.]|jgi:general secretion pathway protein J|nr:prepilin-type N-terminal cleavage/methylation protein [Ramlibacter sp.]MCE3272354.1 prepilin-type N-terminal cleavage/methylation protein [Ramlibacter sp.]
MRRARGFTLVELLVSLFAMALLAGLSWRGLDGMMRARQITEARADEVLALQTGLAQWTADLDAIEEYPPARALEWNGRVLRLTRRSSLSPTDGVRVVGWARREGRWLRWESPPVLLRGDLDTAWQQADLWAQNPSDEMRAREVAITPMMDWQIFFYRGNSWTNPLSSADATEVEEGQTGEVAGAGTQNASTLPDGVRLILLLPPDRAIGGRLQRDWVRPTLSGSRS